MVELSLLDGAVATIMALAVLRGLFIGLIREGFSIVALASAALAVRYGSQPLALILTERSGGDIGLVAAAWLSSLVLGIGVLLVVAIAGRYLRKGARAVGLGWADRAGGAALGAAEGALVASVLVLGATWWFGAGHPALVGSRSVSAFEELREVAAQNGGKLPDVAARFSGPD